MKYILKTDVKGNNYWISFPYAGSGFKNYRHYRVEGLIDNAYKFENKEEAEEAKKWIRKLCEIQVAPKENF